MLIDARTVQPQGVDAERHSARQMNAALLNHGRRIGNDQARTFAVREQVEQPALIFAASARNKDCLTTVQIPVIKISGLLLGDHVVLQDTFTHHPSPPFVEQPHVASRSSVATPVNAGAFIMMFEEDAFVGDRSA